MIRPLAVAPMARPSGLPGRIATILNPATDRRPVRRPIVIAAAVAAAVAVVPLAAVRPAARAAPPATRPAADAAERVRRVRAAEAWLDHVDSLDLRLTKQFETFHPGGPTLSPPGSLELAFDRRRLYRRSESTTCTLLVSQSAYDGRRTLDYARWASPQDVPAHYGQPDDSAERYQLSNATGADMRLGYLTDQSWGQAAPHHYWWLVTQPDEATAVRTYFGRPDEFRPVGRTKFHDVDCDAITCDRLLRTYYVGVADGRLYGVDRDQAAGKAGRGPTQPYERTWFADYREVAPGCWYPGRQGYQRFDRDVVDWQADPDVSQVQTLVEARVNQPLPEALFAQDWTEGVPVDDWSHQPPLSYRWRKRFTPEQWRAVLAAGDARQAEADAWAGKRSRIVGRPAPDFAAGQWVQGRPVTLADLRGKVTFVAFWSAESGAEVARLNEWAAGSAAAGVTVLSVHAAGTSVADVRRSIADQRIAFPVYLDAPGDAGGRGPVFDRAEADRLPSAMVIGRDGRIAFVGPDGQAWAEAVDLAERPTTRPSG